MAAHKWLAWIAGGLVVVLVWLVFVAAHLSQSGIIK